MRVLGIVGVAAFVLSACGLPGLPSRSIQSRQTLMIAGQTCTLIEYRNEELSINGTHAWIETTADCGGRVIDCDLASGSECVARVEAVLTRRA